MDVRVGVVYNVHHDVFYSMVLIVFVYNGNNELFGYILMVEEYRTMMWHDCFLLATCINKIIDDNITFLTS